jgi:penicillin-binding protein 2
MLIFDQLRKDDRHLRTLTLVVLCGLCVLLAGLWWIQIVSVRDYQENLEQQSFRTVRIPAVRGRILDRNGVVLAESRPAFDVCLYLEELRGEFIRAYEKAKARAKSEMAAAKKLEEQRLGRSLTRQEARKFSLSSAQMEALGQSTRAQVASNAVAQVAACIQLPLSLDPVRFARHYEKSLAMPYRIATNLTEVQVHRFEEQNGGSIGVDLEGRSARTYPLGETAAHVLGHLRFDDRSVEGEDAFVSYRLPDYSGEIGVEAGLDPCLRGKAGIKSVLVNNVGYRQTDQVWTPAEPGSNVVLTIDAGIQKAAENALRGADVNYAKPVRGAAVVLDVNTGEVLAMASSPSFDPNAFLPRISSSDLARLQELGSEKNRATQENYQPGSIFKLVVAMAALEKGFDPKQIYHAAPDPERAGFAAYISGNLKVRDTAPPGPYDLRRAIVLSSNSYFVFCGLWTGVEGIVEIGQRVFLGRPAGLPTRQNTPGSFPKLEQVHSRWRDGDTANLSIGQGPIDVTPLQAAVMIAAIANGGKVLQPQLVREVVSAESIAEKPAAGVSSRVRGLLGVKASTLATVREAMRAEVEDAEGTGRAAAVPGFPISGKTGTAQVKNQRGTLEGYTTWFASFAPFDQPRYAVVIMVEDGRSGGKTCAPVAHHIFEYLFQREQGRTPSLASVDAWKIPASSPTPH